MKQHFLYMARYNKWANEKLLSVVSQLSEQQYFMDLDGFFKSIHGALNHMLVGDRIWMHRFDQLGEKPSSLDQILCEDFESYKKAKQQEDDRAIRIMTNLTEDGLASDLSYATMAGDAVIVPYQSAYTHLFNHQTHHRGQVHHMLSQLGIDPPSLDLIYYELDRQAAKTD